jgi:hypothetical protein
VYFIGLGKILEHSRCGTKHQFEANIGDIGAHGLYLAALHPQFLSDEIVMVPNARAVHGVYEAVRHVKCMKQKNV